MLEWLFVLLYDTSGKHNRTPPKLIVGHGVAITYNNGLEVKKALAIIYRRTCTDLIDCIKEFETSVRVLGDKL